MSTEERIIAKIKQVRTSGQMYFIAGRVMGHELATVEGDSGAGIVITSDGQALIGDNIHIGPADDLRRNLAGLVEAAGLNSAELAYFWDKYRLAVSDMRAGNSAANRVDF